MREQRFDMLLDVLERCMTACETCVHENLGHDGDPALIECIRAAMDCGEMCGICARYFARDSMFKNELLSLCGNMCRHCEQMCRKHDLEHTMKCAEVCHECYLACALVAQPH